jgi:nucleotide-binding universal stress UspA family protein
VGTLVVGYDGTDGAQVALDETARLAGELGDDVLVVFAHHIARMGGEVRDYAEAVRQLGARQLEEAERRLAEAGVPARTQLLDLPPAEALLEAADGADARMIVVGSYGERPLKSALVGATPTRLLHLSERPVLVVRARA